jgi:hypothetical protein
VVNHPTYSYLPERQTPSPEVNYEERLTEKEHYSTDSLQTTESFELESKSYNGDVVGTPQNVSGMEQSVAGNQDSETTVNWNNGQRLLLGNRGHSDTQPSNCSNIYDPNCLRLLDVYQESSKLLANIWLRIIENLEHVMAHTEYVRHDERVGERSK